MKNKFIKNTMILILGGFLTKILGMIIKIIMTRSISQNAISMYMLTIPSYNLFITLVNGGFQIAVSKLISENRCNKKEILSTSLIISFFISFTLIFVIILLSKYIPILLHNEDLYYPILSTILSLPFIGISSILKGYFFGKNMMHVQVISNFIEQIIRIILFITILPKINNDILIVSFIIGSNIINELVSIFILSLFLPKKKIKIMYDKNIKKDILSISIPSMSSRLIGTISYFFEPIILTNLLILNGFSSNYINAEYGIVTGYVMQLLLLPSFFSMAISQSIIPIISNAFYKKKYNYIKKKINEVLTLSLLIGIIYTSVIILKPKFFLELIYNANKGSNYVRMMAPVFILLYIQGPIISILQSINKAKDTMKATIYGTIIKILLITVLSFLKLGIYSYIISILVNIIFVTIYDYIKIKKYTSSF